MIPSAIRNFLKWVALVIMTIDHVGAGFFPDMVVLRLVGRLAFPLFALLLVQGYFSTRDAKAYLFRLGVFAVISQLPYSLYFHSWTLSDLNVLVSLFFGLLVCYLLDEQPYACFVLMAGLYFLPFDIQLLEILTVPFLYLAFTLFGNPSRNVPARMKITEGRPSAAQKYFFYAYYPAHLLILAVLPLFFGFLSPSI